MNRDTSKEKKLKMEIFQSVQNNMAAMGFTPNQQQNNERKLDSIQIIVIAILSIDVGTLCVFFFHEANNLEEYMNITFELIVAIAIFMGFISIILRNDDIFNIIDLTTQELSDRSNNNAASQAIHKETIQIVEFLSRFLSVGGVLVVVGFMLPQVIISYFKYFIMDSGSDAFGLFIVSWFPFDWKTPIGYSMAAIWQTTVLFTLIGIMSRIVLPLALTGFMCAWSIAKNWKGDLRKLNKMLKPKQSEAEIYKQVTEFVRTHSKIRQLSKLPCTANMKLNKLTTDFLDVYQVMMFVNFLGCIIIQIVLLLMFQVEIISKDVIDPVLLWKLILYEIGVVGMMFLPCEFGQRLTDTYNEITDRFEQLNWYLFPIKVQRLLPTIINNTNVPIVINCFGVFDGSRDQLKRAGNTVYKTFNVLRKMFN